jgi:hypothetical protein
MELRTYGIELTLEQIAGGYPGTIDAQRAFLQNPMMAKRVPADAREEFLARERELGLEDGPIGDTVKTGFRPGPDGQPLIGAYQIKAMLQQAARSLCDTTSKPSIYQVARAITYGLEVLPREIPISGGRDGGIRQIAQIIAHPRQPSIKVPSTRERSIWVGGTLTFTAIVSEAGVAGKVLTPTIVKALFETGGLFIGLGTDRGYGYGRFTVTAWGPNPGGIDLPAHIDNPARKGLGYVRADKRVKQSALNPD